MADMKKAVLATVLLSIILMGELQRCSGQVHYKEPGWGPGGKRSSNMADKNIFRKRQSLQNSPHFEEDNTKEQRQLAVLRHIARSLAKKFVSPTLTDTDTARNELTRTMDQWANEDNARQNNWI